jgi:predicted RNase H-like nuclease (RuvC/YqgF family)
MLRPAKQHDQTDEVARLRPSATICDLRSWRNRIQISKRVKELEAENEALSRLAARSRQEIRRLREHLAERSDD